MMNNSPCTASGLAFIRDWVAHHPPPQPRSAAFRDYLAELAATADTAGVALPAPPVDMRPWVDRPANDAEGASTVKALVDLHLAGIGFQVLIAVNALNSSCLANDN